MRFTSTVSFSPTELEQLYILVPVHNRKNLTIQLAECLKRQSYKNYNLLLIDDGSSDGTADQILTILPNTIVIRGTGNWWWAGSLQKGFHWLGKNAEPESLVLILNDDLIFDTDYLSTGIELLKKNPSSLILSAAYNQQERSKLEDFGVIYDFARNSLRSARPDEANGINCLSTRGLFLTWKDFKKTGGFRPFLLPHYYSDYEFTLRAARKHGLKLCCFPELKVYMNPDTTGVEKISYSSFSDFRRKAFDIKYKQNPRYTITYYLIAFPFPYNCRHAWREFKALIRLSISLIFKA